MSKLTASIGLLSVVALLVGCDHGTKHLARKHLRGEPAVELIGGVLDLRYTENPEAAFGALRWARPSVRGPALTAFRGLLSLVILVVLLRRRGLGLDRFGLALVLAGALGNLADGLLRGYVVDFIHVHYWPVFNVADICIAVGVGLLLLAGRRRETPRPAGG
jgi:signal peptidase II